MHSITYRGWEGRRRTGSLRCDWQLAGLEREEKNGLGFRFSQGLGVRVAKQHPRLGLANTVCLNCGKLWQTVANCGKLEFFVSSGSVA